MSYSAFSNAQTYAADLPVSDGGTGASDITLARQNLGLVIGVDVQAHNPVLDATTASYTIEEKDKLSFISVTNAVNFETDFLRVDGSLVMTGDLDLGNNGIINGTLDSQSLTIDGGAV